MLIASTARDNAIAGLEFLRGIPGTLGGFDIVVDDYAAMLPSSRGLFCRIWPP